MLTKKDIPHVCEILGFEEIAVIDGHVTLPASAISEIEGALMVISEMKQPAEAATVEIPFEHKDGKVFVPFKEKSKLKEMIRTNQDIYTIPGVAIEKDKSLVISYEAFFKITGINLKNQSND